jgi:hypothetical protein
LGQQTLHQELAVQPIGFPAVFAASDVKEEKTFQTNSSSYADLNGRRKQPYMHLQSAINSIRDWKRSPGKHGSQDSTLRCFQRFLQLSSGRPARATSAQQQNNSICQSAEQHRLARYPSRMGLNQNIFELISQLLKAGKPM